MYGYVVNNPINKIDPTGNDSWIITYGHFSIAINDPDNPGGTIVFDFIPTEAFTGIVNAVHGTVREQRFKPGERLPGIAVPWTRKKQTTAEDIATIMRARNLQKAAESGDLKCRVGVSDLICRGFVNVVEQGPKQYLFRG